MVNHVVLALAMLFEDSAAMLGLLVAFFGIALTQWTGHLYFDGAASVIIGIILIGTAIWLAYETKGLLIGESANRYVIDGIRSILKTHTSTEHVNEVLTMHMGPDFVLASISVDIQDELTSDEIETAVAEMEQRIKNKYPQIKRVFIEAEKRRNKIIAQLKKESPYKKAA